MYVVMRYKLDNKINKFIDRSIMKYRLSQRMNRATKNAISMNMTFVYAHKF